MLCVGKFSSSSPLRMLYLSPQFALLLSLLLVPDLVHSFPSKSTPVFSPQSLPQTRSFNRLSNPPFLVEAEEVSDDEWRTMIREDLDRHQIIPDVICQPPEQVINIDYAGDHVCVHMGNQLAPSDTSYRPTDFSFPHNDSTALHTLIMVDPDAPQRNNSRYAEFLHWLVVNMPGDDITKGETLAEYFGPAPSPRGGSHRYVFIVYRQPGLIPTSQFPRAGPCEWQSRTRFSARQFAQIHDLGQPYAVNFFSSEYEPQVPSLIQRCLTPSSGS